MGVGVSVLAVGFIETLADIGLFVALVNKLSVLILLLCTASLVVSPFLFMTGSLIPANASASALFSAANCSGVFLLRPVLPLDWLSLWVSSFGSFLMSE